MRTSRILVALALASTLSLTACSIEKNGSHDNENVKISTPFGGMSVKTNENVVVADIGLPVYPGATVVKKDKDSGAADLNMSFGSFQLRVKAISYHTGDSSDKVLAFYQKALGRYGDVIHCEGNKPVGSPMQTSEGLACSDHVDPHIHTDIHADVGDINNAKIELKAGSHLHQHIVAIDTQSDGTKFGLVALDLPAGTQESN